MHKLTGKTFDPKYQNKISDDEILFNLDFIFNHFFILTKESTSAKMTPYQFWDYAVQLDNEEGIQTASVDSWKDLTHDSSKFRRDDQYLEHVLNYRNDVAERNNLHLHTIIHPKLIAKENGKQPAPTSHDLKGGSEWFNNGKTMITIHRDNPDGIDCQFIVNKAKPRSSGKKGYCILEFDVSKLVYYEYDNGAKKYADKEKRVNVVPFETPLRPNIEFENEQLETPF